MPENESADNVPHSGSSRRTFLKQASTLVGAVLVTPSLAGRAAVPVATPPRSDGQVEVALRINGVEKKLTLEPRVTLLDALRDRLDLPGTKKGCDHGTCGACTVHLNGQRVLSCLTLAVMAQGKEITTIEGLAQGEQLHPVQQAFVDCDGFQCGFCTPGQIMSSVACIKEGHTHSDAEIREWMSGNLCRCAAYPNILDAVKKAAESAV